MAWFDWASLSTASSTGRLLRSALKLLPKSAVVPIVRGRGCGLWWVVGASTHGCWLGTYEEDLQVALAGSGRPGSVIWDVGAHVGFVTLVAARIVGKGGRVVAFEPLPRNVEFLNRHIRLNHLESRIQVIPAAVGDFEGAGEFFEAANPGMGRLEPGGTLSVRVVTLDGVLERGAPAPSVVKVDVENSELAVLRGSEALVRKARPVFFLSVHTDGLRAGCLTWFREHDYEARPLEGRRGPVLDVLRAAPMER
ncbi:MAG: FkbM family methyltransferase [Acidobacteriia bacterium]|nr:FkbM family methyltransferase [Terriglobia bacterium]